MVAPRTLVLVLAGGAGTRLSRLTDGRAKPTVPFGGPYRLLDVPMSNCLHSGLRDVWVVAQQYPASIEEALGNGRPWDLDRSTGGLRVLPPALGPDREGWHHGTADAVWKQASLVREFAPEALVVLSADAVYRLDYDEVVRRHLDAGRAVTMVTAQVEPQEASRYGVVEVDDEGRITGYAYKPDDPASDLIATEVFVFDPGPTLDALEAIAAEVEEAATDDEERGEALGDLGDHLLPRLVEAGQGRSHRLEGYWRDVGTLESYLDGHLELLGPDPAFEFWDAAWPIVPSRRIGSTVRLLEGAEVVDAELSGGAIVAGRVERSVVGPGAVIEAGATVVSSVVLPGAVVRRGAWVERAIVDDDVEVPEDAHVGGAEPSDAVTLLGRGTELRPGQRVVPGSVLPPDDA